MKICYFLIFSLFKLIKYCHLLNLAMNPSNNPIISNQRIFLIEYIKYSILLNFLFAFVTSLLLYNIFISDKILVTFYSDTLPSQISRKTAEA